MRPLERNLKPGDARGIRSGKWFGREPQRGHSPNAIKKDARKGGGGQRRELLPDNSNDKLEAGGSRGTQRAGALLAYQERKSQGRTASRGEITVAAGAAISSKGPKSAGGHAIKAGESKEETLFPPVEQGAELREDF